MFSRFLSLLGRPRQAEANVIVDREAQEAGATPKLVRDSVAKMRREGYDRIYAVRGDSARRIDLKRPGASQDRCDPLSPMPGGDD